MFNAQQRVSIRLKTTISDNIIFIEKISWEPVFKITGI